MVGLGASPLAIWRWGALLLLAVSLASSPERSLAAPSGTFVATGEMGDERNGLSAANLPDGRVLVAGGYDGGYLDTAEVYDPLTQTFTSTGIGSMTTTRFGSVAAPLPDGKVLVAGGFVGGPSFNDPSKILSSAELFDPVSNTFSSTGVGSMSKARWGAVSAPLPDRRVLVAGGWDGSSYLSSAEIFDPATKQFSSAGVGSLGTPRLLAVAAPLQDGRVLIAGGFDGEYLASAEIFDPATKTFTASGIGSMTIPRRGGFAAPLPDGRVLIGGGTGPGGFYLQSAEAFDPGTASFGGSGFGGLDEARYEAAAVELEDGKVLLAGGGFANDPTRTAALFALRPPPAPTLTGTDPPSPAVNNRAPQVQGSAEAGATVRLYAAPSCAGVTVASKTADSDGSFRVKVTLPSQSTSMVSAAATSVIGTSECSGTLTYQEKTVRCGGRIPTITGTNDADRLRGTKRRDVILGRAGPDTISGLGGADIICGGSGPDRLLGGSGRDTLIGGSGRDLLGGDAGRDRLVPGSGADRCSQSGLSSLSAC
jgi:Ca2+-binding RTX toxin-like protein